MKFLVLWHIELTRLGPEIIAAVARTPDYARKVGDKLECRYHVIGSHGGAWIYKSVPTKNLIIFLPCRPCTTTQPYKVLPPAEMTDSDTVT